MSRLYRACVALLRGSGLTRVRVIRGIKEAAAHRVVVNVLGHRMYVGRQDSLGLIENGVYEPFESQMIVNAARLGDVVLDIGANVGYYTLQLARAVGPNGHIVAFEPDRENFSVLKRNVEMNGYTNVTLVAKAVGAARGKLKLYVSNENLGDHRTYDSGEGRPSYEVEVVALDDYQFDRVDVIKMDIQGAEALAIAGMQQLIAANEGLQIFSEFWPFGLRAAGTEPRGFLRTLRSAGFTLRLLDEHSQTVREMNDEEILRSVPNHWGVNLFCTRIR